MTKPKSPWQGWKNERFQSQREKKPNRKPPQTVWVETYNCGCEMEASRKKDLLGYCGIHGEDRKEIFHWYRDEA